MTPNERARPLPTPEVRGLPNPGRCLVMGVVNVTPDSFSDGGRYFRVHDAVAHGFELHRQGADIIDVGGESTRPGAARVDEAEELRRVIPVIRELTADGLLVSVDTMRARVAERALDVGACLVNDVSGGLADPDMAALVAEAKVPYVVMHWRGHSADMQRRAHYDDVVAEVRAELEARIDAALKAGIEPEQIVVDPGLGFAKLPEHNWSLLRHLDVIQAIGRPVLIGASRKRFLAKLLAAEDGTPRPFDQCDDATTAVTALAAVAGAWCVRVHDVRPSVDAVRVAAAWRAAP